MNTAGEFWRMVDRRGADECWPWLGGRRGRSPQYGSCWWQGKHEGAHRVAYRLHHGRLPKLRDADVRGTCIRQSCHFGLCCNPAHLKPATHKQNMAVKCAQKRDTAKHKARCKRGHARAPNNLYTSKEGLRACRVCAKERERRRRAAARKIRSHTHRCPSCGGFKPNGYARTCRACEGRVSC